MQRKVTPGALFSMILCFVFLFSSCHGAKGERRIAKSHADTDLKPIQLLPPTKDIGRPLMQVLNDRKTIRKYSDKKISDQDLSNILWAAFGMNRPEKGYRTAPSALNWQIIDIYVVLEKGVYFYNATSHVLEPVHPGDIRPETTHLLQPERRSVSQAPLTFLYIADGEKRNLMGRVMSEGDKIMYAACDAGFIGQNVYLYCASEGLGTVVRGLLDREKLHGLLGLKKTQKIILAQSVGHPSIKKTVQLSDIPDGVFYGGAHVVVDEAEQKNSEYKVKVVVKDHQIANIEILLIGDSKYENSSKEILSQILKKQSLDVDLISGATISSKGLIEATENALKSLNTDSR